MVRLFLFVGNTSFPSSSSTVMVVLQKFAPQRLNMARRYVVVCSGVRVSDCTFCE